MENRYQQQKSGLFCLSYSISSPEYTFSIVIGVFFTFVCEDSTKETSLNLCTHINAHIHTLLIGNTHHSFSLLIIAEKHCTTAFIRFFSPAGNKLSSSLLTHIVVSVLTPVQLAQ